LISEREASSLSRVLIESWVFFRMASASFCSAVFFTAEALAIALSNLEVEASVSVWTLESSSSESSSESSSSLELSCLWCLWCFFLWCFFFSFFSDFSANDYFVSAAFLTSVFGFSSFFDTSTTYFLAADSLALFSSNQRTVDSEFCNYKAWDPSMFSDENKRNNAMVLVYFILKLN